MIDSTALVVSVIIASSAYILPRIWTVLEARRQHAIAIAYAMQQDKERSSAPFGPPATGPDSPSSYL